VRIINLCFPFSLSSACPQTPAFDLSTLTLSHRAVQPRLIRRSPPININQSSRVIVFSLLRAPNSRLRLLDVDSEPPCRSASKIRRLAYFHRFQVLSHLDSTPTTSFHRVAFPFPDRISLSFSSFSTLICLTTSHARPSILASPETITQFRFAPSYIPGMRTIRRASSLDHGRSLAYARRQSSLGTPDQGATADQLVPESRF